MNRWWRSLSVRVRLTLWYVAAMVIVLAVYAVAVFVFVSRSVSRRSTTGCAATSPGRRRPWRPALAALIMPGRSRIAARTRKPLGAGLECDGRELLFDERRGDAPAAARDATPRRAATSHRLGATAGAPVRIMTRPRLCVPVRRGPAERLADRQPVGHLQVGAIGGTMRQQMRRAAHHPRAWTCRSASRSPASAATCWLAARSPPSSAWPCGRSTITAARLNDRLPVANPDDELGRLATVFNETLGRLERRSIRCGDSPPTSRTSCGRR